MDRVPRRKPSRRLGWTFAAALLALPTAAQAQGLFFLFGNPSPYEIERRLEASGYVLTGPLAMRGDVYLADVLARGEGPERLVIDARNGAILERFRGRPERWREAAAPPQPAWSDDPTLWSGPRPPAAIGPDGRPPDAFEPPPPGPRFLEAPKAAKPRSAQIKPRPKPSPVANVANPPPAAPRAAPAPVAPAATDSAPGANGARAKALTPAPPVEAAKADAPASAVKPPPPPALPAAAPVKPSNAVNDIPVTPLN
jgi:hypothetical protein